MPTTTPTADLNAVQEFVLDTVKQSQELTLDAVRGIADVVRPLVSVIPESPFSDLIPEPAATVDAGFAFVDQLVSAQHDFTRQLVEALAPQKAAEAS